MVKRLGCRAEYWPRPVPPHNGGEAAAAEDEELDRYLHLFMLNRGILMTPFHNMALMSPQTTAADAPGTRRSSGRRRRRWSPGLIRTQRLPAARIRARVGVRPGTALEPRPRAPRETSTSTVPCNESAKLSGGKP